GRICVDSSNSTRPGRSRRAAQCRLARARSRGAVSMRAVCWYGARDVRVARVPDPQILNRRDAIVKVTSTAICGSDLHLFNGVIPTMKPGDVLGHEFMGEVVEAGSGEGAVKRGDRVVVPFAIACGACWYCREGLTSLCDNSNPNAHMAEALYGFSASGLF